MENQFNEEFIELINNRYEEKYIDYLNKLPNNSLSEKMIKLLQEQDLTERLSKWNDFTLKLGEIKNLKYLSNPFYIGFGNPNAEILFLGKEKAFDIANSPDIFLHESINNNKHWEAIIKKNNRYDSVFNPLFPQLYHKEKNNHKIKARDTWGMYSQIVKGITENDTITSSSDNLDDNFFNHCFTTEVNHIPSKYSLHLKSQEDRKKLLQEPFYKRFKYVIIGAIGSINIDDIKNIFGSDLQIETIEIGENKRRKIEIKILKNETQKIILCNQLSGAAGWTTDAIKNLITEIKK
ncbi:hypothetical protein [Flavobacterium sp. ZB4R12]|uniref:hypothetical protein n=1 Tax=Flavobacterium sp. ZB4R12 TaxID=3398732 RepID=UPI003AACAF51